MTKSVFMINSIFLCGLVVIVAVICYFDCSGGMVCCLSALQAPVQAWLRPAFWIPGIRAAHSHTEKWEVQGEVDEFFSKMVAAAEKTISEDKRGFTMQLKHADDDKHFIQIYTFTKASWLDVCELTIKGSTVEVQAFSTGLFPCCVPLCFVWNSIFCWAPFLDMGNNKITVDSIRQNVGTEVTKK